MSVVTTPSTRPMTRSTLSLDKPELDELPDVLFQLAEGPSQRLVAAGHQAHVEPVLSEGLCDALAHGTGAQDQYLLCDVCGHALALVSRL